MYDYDDYDYYGDYLNKENGITADMKEKDF